MSIADVLSGAKRWHVECGDCLAVLPSFPSACPDAVITDPPYPEIDRPYGRLTEAEWFALMRKVVPECMRVLKPTGSAVFILQPNSERVGRMRTWLWEFMLWVGKEWGIVQDAWRWNYQAGSPDEERPKQTAVKPDRVRLGGTADVLPERGWGSLD